MYFLAIFASVTLLVQIVPVADAAGSDKRKEFEEIKAKNDAELSKLKSSAHTALNAWKDAKDVTDTAKENYYQNTADQNLLKIWNDAKDDEAQARQDYNKALQELRNFSPQKSKVSSQKNETDFANAKVAELKKKLNDAVNKLEQAIRQFKNDDTNDNSKIVKKAQSLVSNLKVDLVEAEKNVLKVSEIVKNAKVPAPKTDAETLAKLKVQDKTKAWKATLGGLEQAVQTWKDVPSTVNLTSLKQAIQVVYNAVQALQDAKDDLKQIQNS